ncbi:Cox6p: cytochrome c oxidase [Lipomyces japonicus]|uniref:Cox6p: cytochrome c oxidase n=1 Tax=Lipomyces japonicus TaxID=56871 RepID=UPI0034CE622F
MSAVFRSVVRSSQVRRAICINARPAIVAAPRLAFLRKYSSAHDEETFEEFNARFEKEFDGAYDSFEVQRILTNAFSYDHVPSPAVIIKALEAARRVNDFATAVRVLEAVKLKVPKPEYYTAYLEEVDAFRKNLGVPLAEELFPERE